MKKAIAAIILVLIISSLTGVAQNKDKPAYQLYTKSGKSIKYGKMLSDLEEAEVVLFGEQHNDPIAHWLQLEVTKDLHNKHKQNLALGAEMFEADVQLVLNEYLTGVIPENNFEQESRIWTNYKTDYKPLVRFAKDNSLAFVATNVPRRYAATVAAGGLDALEKLNADARKYLAPMPITVDAELPGYKNMLAMFGSNTHSNSKAKNIVQAQALKDATMAHFILGQLSNSKRVLHFNGAYHSDNFEGIGWYLKQARPELKIKTITTVQQDDIEKLSDEHKDKADFILVVPASMTRTY